MGEEINPIGRLLIETSPYTLMAIKCIAVPSIILLICIQLFEDGEYMRYKTVGLVLTAAIALLYVFAVTIQICGFVLLT